MDMEEAISLELPDPQNLAEASQQRPKAAARRRRKNGAVPDEDNAKRRCVSTACIACRKRKSKCDGNLPACSSCASVYNTACVYDPNSDHRRKGVYKKDIDKLKTRNSTLEVLIQALLNHPEDEVPALVKSIRTCESLDTVAEGILARGTGLNIELDEDTIEPISIGQTDSGVHGDDEQPSFERQLAGKMGGMRLEEGVMRYIGGTSHLIFSDGQASPVDEYDDDEEDYRYEGEGDDGQQEDPILSWTTVTTDAELVTHLMNMYFTWHWEYFTCVPKALFYQDFRKGMTVSGHSRKNCTPLLVNAMLALGCHFTARPGARLEPDDPATAGDHFSKEAKRLILENDEHEKPSIPTIQALALMSVREAGCGREAKGWGYSGMSFRMACDLGLNLDAGGLTATGGAIKDDLEEDARRITFWGCFLFDKCWSNYLGRLPQLPQSIITIPKIDVFPTEDAEPWVAYTDSGFNQSHAQPSRTRAVARQISALCEISGDLMNNFYNPTDMDKTKGKQTELKKLSDIHQRLEGWKRELPNEFEPKEGLLPSMLVAHMFFQLLYIHLFRPFLRYAPHNSPLPSNVSPRKLCTTAAATISKLLRLYKRSHGLRQICNIAVYITQNACTIHLLNLPDKNARRDITHGVKHLEEIAESWPCARRTLSILCVLSKKWQIELPEEAALVLARCEERFGPFTADYQATSPRAKPSSPEADTTTQTQSLSPPETSPTTQVIFNSYIAPVTPSGQPAHQTQPSSASTSYNILPTTILSTTSIQSPSSFPPPSTAHDFHTYPRSTMAAAQTPNTSVGTPTRMSSRPSIDSITQHPNSANTPASKGSPDDMFGGVDQLLRTSDVASSSSAAGGRRFSGRGNVNGLDNGQDWWLQDQSQLALGFDNWAAVTSAHHLPAGSPSWFAAAAASAATGKSGVDGNGNGNVLDNGLVSPGLLGAGAGIGALGGPVNGHGHAAGAATVNGSRHPMDAIDGFHGMFGYDDESRWYL